MNAPPPMKNVRTHSGAGISISGSVTGEGGVRWVSVSFQDRWTAFLFVLSILFVWRHKKPTVAFLAPGVPGGEP